MDEASNSQGSVSSAGSSSSVFVLSIGGSILFNGLEPDVSRMRELSSTINSLFREGFKFGLVIGGGAVVRTYQSAAREFNVNNFGLDELGISITRSNALLFLNCLEKAHPVVLTDLSQAGIIVDSGRIPVLGGLMPGFTTDAVAALLAEKLNATFVNLSNVDGIYSSDPKVNPRARLYRELSFGKLVELVSKSEQKPGQNNLLDLVAVTILRRSRIPAFFLSASNTENLSNAIRGKPFVGTVIVPDENDSDEKMPGVELSDDDLESDPDSEIEKPKKKRVQKKDPDDYFPF